MRTRRVVLEHLCGKMKAPITRTHRRCGKHIQDAPAKLLRCTNTDLEGNP